MKTFPARALVAALLLAAIVAGCSREGARTGATKPTQSSSAGSTSPTTASTGNPLAVGTSTSTALPTASAEPGVKECRARVLHSQRTGEPGMTYMRAAPTFQQGWGPKCDLLHVGDRCVVKWNGTFTIMTDSSGFVEFQVWTDTGDGPIHKQEVGPVPEQGTFRRWEFPMTVPRAKEVALQMILKDSRHIPIAISDAFVYPVNCPGTRP